MHDKRKLRFGGTKHTMALYGLRLDGRRHLLVGINDDGNTYPVSVRLQAGASFRLRNGRLYLSLA